MATATATISGEVETRVRALREYILLRHGGRTRPEAVGEVRLILPEYPVERWEREDRWEMAFRAAEGTALLSADTLRVDRQLHDLLLRKAQLHDILTEMYDTATTPVLDYDPEREAARSKALADYMKYSGNLDVLQERIDTLASKVSTRYAENSALPRWKQRREDLLIQYREQYRGKGPQYDTLCERLASAVLLSEQVEASPTSIDTAQYLKLATAITTITNQLQKYTEATKSEAIRTEVQDAMVRMMGVVEQVIAPSYPQLWNAVVERVVSLAGGQILELPAPTSEEQDVA